MISNFQNFYEMANKLIKNKNYKILVYNIGIDALNLYNEFKNLIEEKGLKDFIEVELFDNFNKNINIKNKSLILLKPIDIFYSPISREDCLEIIENTIIKGNIIDRLIFFDKDFMIDQNIYSINIDKNLFIESLDNYIANGGFKVLVKILDNMSPKDVYTKIFKLNLRGNSSVGFYNYDKWLCLSEREKDLRYIVFNDKNNSIEDKYLLSKNPYSIIENMAIKAYALGSTKGYIYIKPEYKYIIKNIESAIYQSKEYGLLGKNILGTNFCFNIDLDTDSNILWDNASKNKNVKILQIGEDIEQEKEKNLRFDPKNIYADMIIGDVDLLKEGVSLIETTSYFMKFTKYKSCGKCTPGREGTKRMFKILERIASGETKDEDLDTLDILENTINDTSLCALGTKKIYIDESACVGCTACRRVCPVNAITGEVKKLHKIDPLKCIRCEACIFKCKFNAIKGGVI